MKGFSFLKKLYQGDANVSCKLLSDKLVVSDMLNDKCLVVFLRYIQNLALTDSEMTIKTLMLSVRLIKMDPQRVKPIFPCDLIAVGQDSGIQTSYDCMIMKSLIDRLVLYLNWLLRNPVEVGFTGTQEMEILTSNMVRLTQSSLLKDDRTLRFCDYVNWLAEQELYQLWMGISRQMIHFQEYDMQEFNSFYEKYTMFCTYRRKIPKVKHKELRAVVVTPEVNGRIQRKLNSFIQMDQNCKMEIRSGVGGLREVSVVQCQFCE